MSFLSKEELQSIFDSVDLANMKEGKNKEIAKSTFRLVINRVNDALAAKNDILEVEPKSKKQKKPKYLLVTINPVHDKEGFEPESILVPVKSFNVNDWTWYFQKRLGNYIGERVGILIKTGVTTIDIKEVLGIPGLMTDDDIVNFDLK